MVTASNNNQFTTPNTSLAAYLLYSGFKLILIRYDERSRDGVYIFDVKKDGFDNAVDDFTQGNADVNLARYEHIKGQLIDRIKRGLP